MDDKELTITLLASEVNVVLAALQELPFRISAPVIGKIKAQGDAQMVAESDNVTTIKEVSNG